MNLLHPLAQSDRDRLDDHGLVTVGDCVGTAPHAQHVEELMAE